MLPIQLSNRCASIGSPTQPSVRLRDGNSELNSVDHPGELLVQFEDGAGADAVGFDQLLDTRFANADQSKFRRREEGIGRHNEQDDKHPRQHIRNHGEVILTFQAESRVRLQK